MCACVNRESQGWRACKPVSRPLAYTTGSPVKCAVVLCALINGRGFHDAERESGQSRLFCSHHKLVYFLAIYRMAQVVQHDPMLTFCSSAAQDGLVEPRELRQAARASVGTGRRSATWHQILSCAHQTPRRGLIDKGNGTPRRGPKVVD